MTPASLWLRQRLGDVPPSLLDTMDAAVAAVADIDPHDVGRTLAAAARSCLGAALRHADDRAGALPLLAADALVTAACEAAVEQGPHRLAELADLFEPSALEALASPA